jgi:5-methylcytosine-specific restriction protein A
VRRDNRSAEADAYRGWYKTARWQRLRARQLAEEPLCRFCQANGIIEPAKVCDHVERHMGDETKFWQGPFQSLCGPCHNSTKQALEKSGTPKITVRIGLDGWPQ